MEINSLNPVRMNRSTNPPCLLTLYFYGIRRGTLAAVIVHSYTWYLWGHPYGCINFISEAVFVGFFLRRGYRNLLLLDGCFWLVLGMPLAWFYHAVLLHMDGTTATFIMLKQAVNGVFNAMLAALVISFPPIRRAVRPAQTMSDISLRDILFNVFVMLVLLPSLSLTMVEARKARQSLEEDVVATLRTTSDNLRIHLQSWFDQNVQCLRQLAGLACRSAMVPDERLQHQIEVLHGAFTDFLALHVEDAGGRTIAFSPRVNEKGEDTIGRDFSDQFWFQDSKARDAVAVSEVHQGRVGVFTPIVTVAAPVCRDGAWGGTAAGPLNLAMVKDLLASYDRDKTMEISLVDAWDKVIASTARETVPMQVRKVPPGDAGASREDRLFFWQPDDPALPSMTRWKRSYYVLEASVGDELPWALTLKVPIAPLQKTLYSMYVTHLFTVSLLIGLALVLSLFLSRWLTRPLARLASVSHALPEQLAAQRRIEWPVGSTTEIDGLIGNLRSMAESLVRYIQRLQERGNELNRANEALRHQIEERESAEREREKVQAQLHQAQKMETVGRLAGGVAHDFNNMLGIIMGNTEMAQMRTGENSPAAKYLHEIMKASSRSADLVRQLLAFARKQTISPRVLDLNDTVAGMLSMLRRLIGEHLDLAWQPGRDLWPVKLDPSQLDQILVNLVVNARDAMAGSGQITIVTGKVLRDVDAVPPDGATGPYVVLTVSDTGAGMSPEVRERLFEPFFTTKEVGKGTGLGLATVFGIVKQNNGFIEVASEPGQGTTCRIFLPPAEGSVARADLCFCSF